MRFLPLVLLFLSTSITQARSSFPSYPPPPDTCPTQGYFIYFPDDVLVTACNATNVYGQPIFFGEGYEHLVVSYEDEVFPIIHIDACFRVDRTWTVLNPCTYDSTQFCIYVPNPNPSPILNHPSNLAGPTVSACGTMPPWNASMAKVYHTDTAATNFCTYWNANANCYQYRQFIKILDSQNPEVLDCPATPLVFTDSSENDASLWNNVFNPNSPAQDLSEAVTDLQVNVADACTGGSVEIRYLLFLDLDGDGIMETVIKSNFYPPTDSVFYGNASNPNYSGGTPVSFDNRSLPTNQKWRFVMQQQYGNPPVTAAVRWNTMQSPGTFVVPKLPAGMHKIKWIVTDACGNETICEYGFTVLPDSTVGNYEPESKVFALYQNEPNPFSGHTIVAFYLPDAALATLTIFDLQGRMLYRQSGDYDQGDNVLALEEDLLGVSGILYYKLESAGNVAWRKMVLVR